MTFIGDYRVLSTLGSGTFGTVYKVSQDDKFYALKQFKDTEDLVDFYREVAAYSLLDNPNILKLLNVNITNDGKGYIVFDLYPKNLSEWIKSRRFGMYTRQGNGKKYIQDMMSGLAYIHSLNIIHRDFVPKNILVNGERAIIADFGTSKMFDRGFKQTPTITQLYYRAPEILNGAKKYTSAVDIWSLGCIALEIYYGRPYFTGGTEIDMAYAIAKEFGWYSDSEIFDGCIPLPKKHIQIDDKFYQDLVNKCLNLDPEKRMKLVDTVDDTRIWEIVENCQVKSITRDKMISFICTLQDIYGFNIATLRNTAALIDHYLEYKPIKNLEHMGGIMAAALDMSSKYFDYYPIEVDGIKELSKYYNQSSALELLTTLDNKIIHNVFHCTNPGITAVICLCDFTKFPQDQVYNFYELCVGRCDYHESYFTQHVLNKLTTMTNIPKYLQQDAEKIKKICLGTF